MRLCIIVLFLIVGMTMVSNQAYSLTLASNGVTQYQIALAADAIPAEATAAVQLQQYLQQITGASFPVKSEKDIPENAPQILVGAGQRVKVLLPQQDWKTLGDDGIVIQTIGNNLILAGGRPRGTLYAVFQFLEDEAGCRWWTPTEKDIPHKSTFTIGALNTIYTPPFSYRENLTTEVYDPAFATILKENGHFEKQPEEWGGHYRILGWCHTLTQLIPPEKYFHAHPEWFSDPANHSLPCTANSVMPKASATQLCLPAPGLLEEVTKNALAWIHENPTAGYISISESDVAPYCQSDACKDFYEREGSQSGVYVDFVNKVAAEIKKQYPDFMVETLAYHDSEKPPKTIRPADNVIIRMAPIGADYGHPIDSDWNKNVRDNIIGWSAIASNLFIWNYVTNFHYGMLPHPNRTNLANDLRFFAAHNVKGIFEQGDNFTNNVGDFVQWRAWLLGHLMWNPQLDQEQLTNEFLNGYYGAAGPYLKQYLDLMQQSYLLQNRKLSTYNDDFSFLTLDVMNQATQLFQSAMSAVADQKVLLDRVQREKLSLDLAWIIRYKTLKRIAASEKKTFSGPADPLQAIDQFAETARRFGVRNYSEGGKFEDYIPKLKKMFPAPAPLPDFAQNYPAKDVIDLQQNEFTLYGKGKSTDIFDDENASDKKAARLGGASNGWLVQEPLNTVFEQDEKQPWHAYALIRAQIKTGSTIDGSAAQIGLYDAKENRAIKVLSVPLAKIAGEQYHAIDLGTNALNTNQYYWFASNKNPSVENLYIDRIILIRQ